MVAALFDITRLLPALTQGELILTANNRLRNQILRAYAAHRLTGGVKVWPAPEIYPLNHWLHARWQDLQDRAFPPAQMMIASAFQRQYLWENIIAHSSASDALLQPEPLAQSADSGLRNLELWRLSEPDLAGYDNHNTACFCAWLKEFQQRLTQHNLLTEETAQAIIAHAFAAGELAPVPRIHLQGFDDIPPLYQYLLEVATPELILQATPQFSENIVNRVTALNDEAELRAAAQWSKAQLEQDKGAVIGVIVPNLGQCREQVERIFTEVFEPLAALPEVPRYTLPFNFSAGRPLATTPPVYAALELLNLNRSQWDLEPLTDLLQSPFFGDADAELVLRAQLCERLRKLGKFSITASDLRYHSQRLCQKLGHLHADNLAARFLALESNRRAGLGHHSANYWIDFFQQQLHALGWPGTRRLDSQEYQQVKLWYRVMDDFARLDSSGIQLDFHQALKQLRSLTGKTPFQAQTPDSPIQILGALEGAGLQFSHCWVMGLHHRHWPPAPAPNPLLPLALQREHKMPHSSTERELVFARALTENYRHCAREVIFSSARTDSENELRPSALIRTIPLTDLQQLVPQAFSCAQQNSYTLAAAQELQLIHSARGPALPLTASPTRGGASLFKHQAACPFNAFARLRLGATVPDQPVAGFSPIERGNLLHDALAMVWRELGSSIRLHALDDNAEHTLLMRTTGELLRALQQKRPRELSNFYCQLEQERLVRLLTAWLAQERTRPPFTVIAIEEESLVQFAGLQLNLRIDRVDQLQDGSLLLIDYKTGEPRAKSWLGERPDEPQLPLYAVSHADPVAAIAFAQINAKTMQWIGTGDLPIYHDGIKPPPLEWPHQLEEWHRVLQRLAQDFIAGDARVDFKDTNAQLYSEELIPLNRSLEADSLQAWIEKNSCLEVEGSADA